MSESVSLSQWVTYLGRFKCSSAHALSLLSLTLLRDHCIVTRASWNNHRCICISTLYALVEHDILRVVLSTRTQKNEINDVTEKIWSPKLEELARILGDSTKLWAISKGVPVAHKYYLWLTWSIGMLEGHMKSLKWQLTRHSYHMGP